ncbi:MAG: zinc ribbon domain-containing protein [Lachnospiraceae bacterium]|nr:zinc ribbon domain-containing protein [Lachnospiraceae bacterium]
MSKKCVKCGHPLPEDASFCPCCTAVQAEKQEIQTPRRWKKKALGAAVVLLILAGAGAVFSMYHRPVAYEANAQIVYPDKDHSYKLLVTYSESDGMAGQAQGDRTDLLADGLDSALPCQLYVLNEETGEVAWEEFAEKVKFCEVETVPQENAKKLEYMEPAHDENFPNAAYVSNLHFMADTGSNDIFWKLTMENGDTISLKTRLTIEKQEVVTYRPEDTPMETTEELNTLLASIENEVSSDTPVYLYLPAVTYDGEITFGDHVWQIFGSTDGDAATTFNGTVHVNGKNGNYGIVSGIRFEGNSGTGLNANCFVLLSGCSFSGWDIAAIAQDGAWVSASDCTFTDNGTALKLNTGIAYGSSPDFLNNTFTGNGTAVCIDRLPGNEILNFAGSIFSGNGTDIENKTKHTVDTSNVVFE